MARRLLQRKNRKHPEPLHDSIRRGKSRVNENRFNVPVARARDADNALRPSTRWWMSFYPACPRAESWLSSKDPTICKPELGRTPTIHRFFRFTPAQSCILIRADFIRNAWQLNASGSFGSFSRSSSFVSSYFYCIFQNYRRVLMRSMTRFQFVIFNLFIEKTMRNCKNYISKENFLFFSSNWGKLSYKCIFLQILRYL